MRSVRNESSAIFAFRRPEGQAAFARLGLEANAHTLLHAAHEGVGPKARAPPILIRLSFNRFYLQLDVRTRNTLVKYTIVGTRLSHEISLARDALAGAG
jgi:hypothetical protein